MKETSYEEALAKQRRELGKTAPPGQLTKKDKKKEKVRRDQTHLYPNVTLALCALSQYLCVRDVDEEYDIHALTPRKRRFKLPLDGSVSVRMSKYVFFYSPNIEFR